MPKPYENQVPRTWCDLCKRVSTHLPIPARIEAGWAQEQRAGVLLNICPRCDGYLSRD